MASTKLEDLTPDLWGRAVIIVERCATVGETILIYCTRRPPEEQAKLFRQSRTLAQIERKAEYYRRHGYDCLADILMSVGPQPGKLGAHVTKAGPGESWHNFSRAFDGVPLLHGKAMWKDSYPGWETYGRIAMEEGLEWAGQWTRFKEFPHVQIPADQNPIKTWSPEEMKEILGL